MPLTKLSGFSKLIASLADKPNTIMSATELKAYWDSSPEELRQALNALIDVLTSTTADSGAKNIAIQSIVGLAGANVQEALQSLFDVKTDKIGNHSGTWQGLNPSDFETGSQALQLNEISILSWMGV